MATDSTRLVQLVHPQIKRRIALVQEPSLLLLKDMSSIYHLTLEAINEGKKIKDIINLYLTNETLDYSSVYNGESEWKLLPSFDHPENVMNCFIPIPNHSAVGRGNFFVSLYLSINMFFVAKLHWLRCT